jgi:hypothetical protein
MSKLRILALLALLGWSGAGLAWAQPAPSSSWGMGLDLTRVQLEDKHDGGNGYQDKAWEGRIFAVVPQGEDQWEPSVGFGVDDAQYAYSASNSHTTQFSYSIGLAYLHRLVTGGPLTLLTGLRASGRTKTPLVTDGISRSSDVDLLFSAEIPVVFDWALDTHQTVRMSLTSLRYSYQGFVYGAAKTVFTDSNVQYFNYYPALSYYYRF